MEQLITKEQIEVVYEEQKVKAKDIVKKPDLLEKVLREAEEILKDTPVVGEQLSQIPVLISMVKSYITKEYKEIPVGSIIAIIAALLYWILPKDLVNDKIKGIGHLDDAVIVGFCLNKVSKDVKKYIKWRDEKETVISV